MEFEFPGRALEEIKKELENEILEKILKEVEGGVGFKANNLLDPSMVYSPYMPLYHTGPIQGIDLAAPGTESISVSPYGPLSPLEAYLESLR